MSPLELESKEGVSYVHVVARRHGLCISSSQSLPGCCEKGSVTEPEACLSVRL